MSIERKREGGEERCGTQRIRERERGRGSNAEKKSETQEESGLDGRGEEKRRGEVKEIIGEKSKTDDWRRAMREKSEK